MNLADLNILQLSDCKKYVTVDLSFNVCDCSPSLSYIQSHSLCWAVYSCTKPLPAIVCWRQDGYQVDGADFCLIGIELGVTVKKSPSNNTNVAQCPITQYQYHSNPIFRVYTKTAHEPKRPRPKRPTNFWHVQNGHGKIQNGPHTSPKRPMARSKTAHRLKRSTKSIMSHCILLYLVFRHLGEKTDWSIFEGYLVEDCQHPPSNVLSSKHLYSTP